MLVGRRPSLGEDANCLLERGKLAVEILGICASGLIRVTWRLGLGRGKDTLVCAE